MLVYDETYLSGAQQRLGAMLDFAVDGWLSQRELACAAGVPVRTLQQYEQRQKDINHARADYEVWRRCAAY